LNLPISLPSSPVTLIPSHCDFCDYFQTVSSSICFRFFTSYSTSLFPITVHNTNCRQNEDWKLGIIMSLMFIEGNVVKICACGRWGLWRMPRGYRISIDLYLVSIDIHNLSSVSQSIFLGILWSDDNFDGFSRHTAQ